MNDKHILIVGASKPLGLEIVRRLCATGHNVVATYRTPNKEAYRQLEDLGAGIVQLDVTDETALATQLDNASGAIFTPILTVSKNAASLVAGRFPVVFFSSNNVAVDFEADVYARLRAAEDEVHKRAPEAIIFRPTMIYGYPGDGNIANLVGAMRRFPVVPMPGHGKALQQPIYYKDVAKIACEAITGDVGSNEICTIAGPQPVSQKILYQEVARSANAKPLIAPMPAGPISQILRVTATLGLKAPLSAAQVARANQDKTPKAEPVIYGETTLAAGLNALIRDLDETP